MKSSRRRVPRPTGRRRPTNNAGGLEGGVTNGEDLRVSAYMKPISTLMKPLRSVDLDDDDREPRPPSSGATSARCRPRPSSAKRWWRSCWPMRSWSSSAATRSRTSTATGGADGRHARARSSRRSRRRARGRCCVRSCDTVTPALPNRGRAGRGAITPEVRRADRRHDRDDVRRARHRPGGHADRRPLRVFVVDLSVGRKAEELIVMINPEFVERDGMQLEEEGCLSAPGFNATVVRPKRAVVKGLDRDRRGAHRRGPGPARPRLPARDGSSGRHGLHRPPARHQARSDRPQDSEAEEVREVVSVAAAAPRRVLRHAGVCRPVARSAASSRHEVVAVVSQPDRPRGRGHQLQHTPAQGAGRRGIPVLQPRRFEDEAFLQTMRGLGPDLGVVVAFGRILPDALLASARWA